MRHASCCSRYSQRKNHSQIVPHKTSNNSTPVETAGYPPPSLEREVPRIQKRHACVSDAVSSTASRACITRAYHSHIKKLVGPLTSTGTEMNKTSSTTSSVGEVEKVPWWDCLTPKKLFAKVEDRPTPQAIYNWRIYLTAFVASFGAIAIGYDGGFIGGTVALESFRDEFGLDAMSADDANEIIANVISVFHAGCFFGALLFYPFSHYLGRKVSMIIMAFFILAGSCIMLAASKERGLAPIYIGRVIAGLGVGASTNVTPVYLAEIAPAAIRGQMVAIYEVGWRIGDLVGFWIGYGVNQNVKSSYTQWLIPFAVQIVPAAMFLFGSLVVLESPRWLITRGRYSQALKNLQWLRRLDEDDEYLQYELESFKWSIEQQREEVGLGLLDPFKQLASWNISKRLLITSSLFLIQNFMGIQSLNYYSPRIFASLGVEGTSATLFSTGLFGVVKFALTFVYILFIVDNPKLGRRVAFLGSSVVCALSFFYIGGYLKVEESATSLNEGASKAAIFFLFLWVASFIVAWSGGPFVVGSEVFMQSIRSFTQSINAAMSWLPIFIMSRFTGQMITHMRFGVFFFFAGVSMVSIPFVWFLVPETKGVPLEEMDFLFNSGVSAQKSHKVVMQRVRERREADHETNKLESIASAKATDERIEFA